MKIELRSSEPNQIADYLELYVLFKNKPLSKSQIMNILENAGIISTAEGEEREYIETIAEGIVDSTLNELERRQILFGDDTPFSIENNRIIPQINWKNYPELIMCLIFSIKGVEKKRGRDDGTKLFEKVSKEVAKHYLNGDAELIGFPNKISLKKQIDKLAEKMNERIGLKIPKSTDKDCGVDIIAWKSHNDKRSNQIVLLLQCGAGIHVFKKREIPEKKWKDFINWSADFCKGIIIPIIVKEDDWDSVREYNLIFDRIRIHKILKSKGYQTQLKDELINWCINKLN